MRLLCRIFGHRRCSRRARRFAGLWRSSCRWCGADLIRIAPKRWRPFRWERGTILVGTLAESPAIGRSA